MNIGGGWREPINRDEHEDLGEDPIDNPVEDPLDGHIGKQMLIVLGISIVTLAVLLGILHLAGVVL